MGLCAMEGLYGFDGGFLGKGKKKSSKKGGKKAAKKSSKKGAKKSSPKGKGHAAKKAGKAKTVTASLNHYAASNGKWTIGGLNKPDVFSLITHNGMACRSRPDPPPRKRMKP